MKAGPAASALVGGAVVLVLSFAPWMDRDAATLAAALDHDLASSGFSGAALVAQGEQVLLARGYGMADAGDRRPNTPQTVFKIASATKPITAVTVLRLVDRGLIDLDQPVAAHLPGFPGGEAITPHHLLSHTAGLARDLAPLVDVGPRAPVREAVEAAPATSLVGLPGGDWSYSNFGYQVLEVLVEEVSGRPFADVVSEEVFVPAGMASATARPAFAPPPPGPGFAVGHVATDGGSAVARPSPAGWWGGAGSGGVLATVGDLHRFHRALATGALLPASLQGRMYSGPTEGYGYGWFVGADGDLAWHDGDLLDEGFHSWLVRDLDRDVVVVVLGNSPSWRERGDFLVELHADDPEVAGRLSLWPVPWALAAIAGGAAARLAVVAGRLRRGTHRLRRPPWWRVALHLGIVVASLLVLAATLAPLSSASWRLAWALSPSWAKLSTLGLVAVLVAVAWTVSSLVRRSPTTS